MTELVRRTIFSRISVLLVAVMMTSVTALTVIAQEKAKQIDQSLQDLSTRPIHVTVRTFQMIVKRDAYQELNDQVFRMSTASLTNYDQWISTFKPIYPEFEIDLLRSDYKRVFRTSKPGIISLVKQPDGRDIEIQLFGAQSYGDGVTPGTTLIPEVALHFPNSQTNKPLGFSIQPLEVESGKTYFFAVRNMRMQSTDFVNFVRPNAPVERFDGHEIYLLFAFSVDLDTTKTPARLIDERHSVELQAKATKKVMPEMPAGLRSSGLGGNARVRVEVSPEGKVTKADVHYSTFPEINRIAVEAARQWEFPTWLFETDKNPITCFITFSFPAQPPAQKVPSSNSAKQ